MDILEQIIIEDVIGLDADNLTDNDLDRIKQMKDDCSVFNDKYELADAFLLEGCDCDERVKSYFDYDSYLKDVSMEHTVVERGGMIYVFFG